MDRENGFIYYSFTTELVKTDLQGNLIGSVTGLLGHLGCIDFCDRDGRLYGSLEYKRDAIGQDILERLGSDAELPLREFINGDYTTAQLQETYRQTIQDAIDGILGK